MKFLRDESILLVALVQAALVLGAAFGLHLTGEQVAGIVGFFSAVLALVIRQVVSSPTTVAAVATDAATRTAAQLTSSTVGGAGKVTAAGADVVSTAASDALDIAGHLVSALAPTKGEGS